MPVQGNSQAAQVGAANPLTPTGESTVAGSGSLPLKLAVTLLVLILGAVEGWFERTDFATDAISYLDISRAIPSKDWKMILNPLWSVGYPLLLAAARPFFSPTPAGEWLSIHAVNLMVFFCAWLAFIFLLKSASRLVSGGLSCDKLDLPEFLLLAGTAVFIAIELCVDTASRVGPDSLVSMLFFLATALVLRILQSQDHRFALGLGLVLGAGYWSKGIFLPLSLNLVLVLAAALAWKKRNPAPAFVALVVFAVVTLPYVAALSWSYGHFTLGESGRLNYAFHVNYLPRWTNWQGQPPGYGTPIHPTHEVMKNPSLFVFGEPYHNTYPPFGNVVYWYEGYRQFWSPKYQLIGIARDIRYLLQILFTQPIFYAVTLSMILLVAGTSNRKVWFQSAGKLWPFYVPALLGVALYVQVHLEARYLGSFLAILCLVPFVTTLSLHKMPSATIQRIVLAVMALGALMNYAIVDRAVFAHIRHHYTFQDDPQWKLGTGLQKLGFHPGDGFGAIGGPNASCTWAYIVHLRIVAELGGEPYDQQHPAKGLSGHEVEYFWRTDPETRAKILNLFHQGGAVAVIASDKPADISVPLGWRRVEGTGTWVYSFSSSQ